jgi:tRNA(adenine34) deaminase
MLNDVSAHAEIKVLRAAGKQKGDWRLSDCTLYVTLEPCPMCTGAILAARVGRVVYGAKNPIAGAMGSVIDLPRYPLGSKPVVESGVMEDACRDLLQDFFRKCR